MALSALAARKARLAAAQAQAQAAVDDGDKLDDNGFLLQPDQPRRRSHSPPTARSSPRKRRATSKRPASPPPPPDAKPRRKRYFASDTSGSAAQSSSRTLVEQGQADQGTGLGGDEGFVRFIESEDEGAQGDDATGASDSDDSQGSSDDDKDDGQSSSAEDRPARLKAEPESTGKAKAKAKRYLTPRQRKQLAKAENGQQIRSGANLEPPAQRAPPPQLPGWQSQAPRVGGSWKPVLEGDGKNIVRAQSGEKGKARQEAERRAVVALRHGESLLLGGIARLEVLHGSVRLGAATLHPTSGSRLLLAPVTSPLPFVEAIGAAIVDSSIVSGLGMDETQPFTAILTFTDVETGLESLARSCPLAGSTPFDVAAHVGGSVSPTLGLTLLRTIVTSTVRVRALDLPKSWTTALDTFANDPGAFEGSSTDVATDEPLRILIRGAKKVGKSTFARQALHALISCGEGTSKVPRHERVAFLDSDLGQPEFSVPGTVALHLFERPSSTSPHVLAPSWISHRQPLRSHFLGSTTPRDDPEAYIAALADLVSHHARYHPSAPIIVNTQGWNKGLGADLLTRLEHLVLPTHIVDILPPPLDPAVGGGNSGGGGGRFDPSELPTHMQGLAPHEAPPPPRRGAPYLDVHGAILSSGPIIITLDPGVASQTTSSRLTAADIRRLSIMSYLHSINLGHPTGTSLPSWDFTHNLVEKRPFSVDVKTGIEGGVYVLPGASAVPRYLALEALNGSLAALVVLSRPAQQKGGGEEVDGERGELQPEPERMWDRVLKPSPGDVSSLPFPPFHASHALGIVLVRSIDVERGTLQLLTPLSPALLLQATAPSVTQGAKREAEGGEEEKVLALVKGSVELPIWASLDADLVKRSLGGGGSGVSKTKPPSSSSSTSAKGKGNATLVSLGGKEKDKGKGRLPSLCGVPLRDVPFVQWPEGFLSGGSAGGAGGSGSGVGSGVGSGGVGREGQSIDQPPAIGTESRRVRRNVQRRGQR